MDRLSRMAVFEAIARTGSVAGAARVLDMTPSRASKALAALEAELGVRLIRRTTRQLMLTAEGERYLARCREILAGVRAADDEARQAVGVISGLLRVTAPVAFGALHLGPVVADFLARYPAVTLELTLDDRFHDLGGAPIDVALRIGRLTDSSLVARRLGSCRMALCAAPEFLQGRRDIEAPSDLDDLPILAFSEAVTAVDWTLLDETGHLYSLKGRPAVVSNNMQLLASAALTGAGVVFGPTFVLGPYLQRGELVRVLPTYEPVGLDINAVYAHRAYLPGTVRAFVDFLIEAFIEPFAWDVKG